jgi:NADH:ubiquinone oxidoreductase subunit K
MNATITTLNLVGLLLLLFSLAIFYVAHRRGGVARELWQAQLLLAGAIGCVVVGSFLETASSRVPAILAILGAVLAAASMAKIWPFFREHLRRTGLVSERRGTGPADDRDGHRDA